MLKLELGVPTEGFTRNWYVLEPTKFIGTANVSVLSAAVSGGVPGKGANVVVGVGVVKEPEGSDSSTTKVTSDAKPDIVNCAWNSLNTSPGLAKWGPPAQIWLNGNFWGVIVPCANNKSVEGNSNNIKKFKKVSKEKREVVLLYIVNSI